MDAAGLRVLVVLVASDGASVWLPDVLDSIAAQTYRPLDVVALDNGTTDGSGALLEERLGERRVARVADRLPYPRAVALLVEEARAGGFEPDAYLFLHDDCALDPDCLATMVETLSIQGVGIVAPRLVDWDDPSLLQDVGQTTDRFGRAVPRVERGELDQGQIEGVRAVLYVRSTAMLVDRELVDRIGLFDERFEALREDLDFCWRARICGALTVVAGEARARHAEGTARNRRPSPARGRLRELADRHLVATLLKNVGLPRALVAVPMTIAISFANALLFLVGGRRKLAVQVLRALAWNVRGIGATLRDRRRIQSMRTVDDREISRLQHHGSRRMRAQIERIVERLFGGEILTPDDEDLDAPPPTLLRRIINRPAPFAIGIALVLGVIATRELFVSGTLSGTDHGPFPASPREFFEEFTSGWRGVSGAAPATPGHAFLGLFSMLLFGSTWLAHRVLLAAIVPLSAFAASRLARRVGLGKVGQVVAATAYGLSPAVLGAFGRGRIIESLVAVALPVAVSRLLRVGKDPLARSGLGVPLIVTVVAASIAPWLFVGILLAGVALAAARRSSEPLRNASLLVGAGIVALVPWSLELFRSGSPLLAGGQTSPPPFLDLVTLDPHGLVRTGVSFGLVALAILGASAARPAHLPLVRDAAALIFAGLAAGVAGPWVPLLGPRAGLPLLLAAIGAALLAAIAAHAVVPLLARRTFGLPHFAALVTMVVVILQSFGTVSYLASGPHPGLETGRGLVPEFFAQEAESGAFRILWLDGTSRRPRFAITGPEGITMRDHLERPAGPAYDAAARAVEVTTGRAGTAAGRILGTLGVRYVIVRPGAAEELAVAVGDQIEINLDQIVEGARIFRNAIDMPVATAMRAPAWARVSKQDLDAAQGVETNPSTSSPFRKVKPGLYRGTAPEGTRAVLVGEPFHSGWRARIGGTELEPRRSFGWALGFDPASPTAGDKQHVVVEWRGQVLHRVGVVLWLAVVLVLAAAWGRGGTLEEIR